MNVTLSRPTKKLTIVSLRHIYRCKEYPRWRIERSHITAGEGSSQPYPDVWQVWHFPKTKIWRSTGAEGMCSYWELVSEHRTKAAAVRAMAKAISKKARAT